MHQALCALTLLLLCGLAAAQEPVPYPVPVEAVRVESLPGGRLAWVEAESFVDRRTAYFGSFAHRDAWTAMKLAHPNESEGWSLVSPESKRVASVRATVPLPGPGDYSVWVRARTFKPYGKMDFALSIDGARQAVRPPCDDPQLERSYTWVKVGAKPFRLGATVELAVANDVQQQVRVHLDALLFSQDPAYVPADLLPRHGRFTALPYTGSRVRADFWCQDFFAIPLGVCRGSTQHFLMRLRNLTDAPLARFAVEVRLPAGLRVVDPSRRLRWAGDPASNADIAKAPPFMTMSPDRCEADADGVWRLVYERPVAPYDLYDKRAALFVVSLAADGTAPATGEVRLRCRALDGSWTGEEVAQAVEVLPALTAKRSSSFTWAADVIYSEFLGDEEYVALAKTFAAAGFTEWSTRVRENVPALRAVHERKWDLLRAATPIRLSNWGEIWWPGSPWTEESRDYLKAHAERGVVSRRDDRGIALDGRAICPTHLIEDADENYLAEHMRRVTARLRESGIVDYIEDAEYSSPLSFCFCPRCRQAFAAEAGLDPAAIKDLEPDALLAKHQKAWIAFRIHQNTRIAHEIAAHFKRFYPEGRFHMFCSYDSEFHLRRYGIEWQDIMPHPAIDGAYIGGGLAGTPPAIEAMRELCAKGGQSFISVANATLSFPSGADELSDRSPANLHARIIHDLVAGSRGLFVWWWGSLDGYCMRSFQTAADLAVEHEALLLAGARTYRKLGKGQDCWLITVDDGKDRLVCVSNPSRRAEEGFADLGILADAFAGADTAEDLLNHRQEPVAGILARRDVVMRSGEVWLWRCRSAGAR